MTEAEVKQIAEEAAEKAIRKFLLMLGVPTSTEESIVDLQADFRHLRQSRLKLSAVSNRILMVATESLVTGGIGYLTLLLTKVH